MGFDKNFNFFEFTEKILKRFRKETGFKLSGYEFQYIVKRDWNCPIDRININLLIYGEDYAHTVFDENYNSVDKVIDLLFVHLRDDAGFDDLKYGMISALINRMENYTETLTDRIKALSKKENLIVDISEKYPEELYENGFPVMQYKVFNIKKNISLNFDFDYNMRGFNDTEILEAVRNEVLS
jgi:Holliday junction resolvasome RuvABC ATP-dependent DNA helicase subunit